MGRPSDRVAEHFAPDDLPGLVLLFSGALLCAISFCAVQWYSVSDAADSAGRGFTFADLHADADQLVAPVASAYFDRWAWGLVAAAVLFGVLARLVGVLAAPMRTLAFLIAVAGLVLTYYAMAQLFDAQHAAGGSVHGVLHDASYGLYLAFVGYALLAGGALVGYRSTAS